MVKSSLMSRKGQQNFSKHVSYRKAAASSFISLLVLALVLVGCSSQEKQSKGENLINIGYQKYASVNILKERGGLEAKLAESGYSVEWIEFPGGPQLLEALNVGSIDFGHTGEAPPIFAQAAGAPLVYLAHSEDSGKAESILVPKDSSIQSAQDLVGKKVALNKGSNVHYLLVKYLEREGVDYNDLDVVFLPPADARAAFESGNVDAWVIWEPFYSAAQLATEARVLVDGEGLVHNYEIYLASRDFATKHKEAVEIILDQINEIEKWAQHNQPEVAKLLAPALGIDEQALVQALSHRGWGVLPITEDTVAAQQSIADAFYKLALIPKEIVVREATLLE